VAPATLARVRAPVLLVVGGRDEEVLGLNRATLLHLPNAELEIVRGATHLFEEPGALDVVVRLAAGWFGRHLARDDVHEARAEQAFRGGGLRGGRGG